MWLKTYGAKKFLDAFLQNAQDAEGRCIYCNLPIYLDIIEGCGIPDWQTLDGDYGCEAGVGSHLPNRLVRRR